MHPARRFILYLLTIKDSRMESDNNIRELLSDLQLFESAATPEVLASLRELVELPANYVPGPTKHQPSVKLQEDLQVRTMHVRTPAVVAAEDVLVVYAVRETIERLLLGRVPIPNIVSVVKKKHEYPVDEETIREFKHYFFDVDALGYNQWTTLLKESRGWQYRSQLHGQPDVALWQFGETIQVEGREALEEALVAVLMRLRQLRDAPLSRDTVQMTFWCADSIVKLQQALAETDARLSELVEKLRQFRQSKVELHIQPAETLGRLAAPKTSAQRLEAELKEVLESGDNNRDYEKS